MIYLHKDDFDRLVEAFPKASEDPCTGSGDSFSIHWTVPRGHVFDSSMPGKGVMSFEHYHAEVERRIQEQIDRCRTLLASVIEIEV